MVSTAGKLRKHAYYIPFREQPKRNTTRKSQKKIGPSNNRKAAAPMGSTTTTSKTRLVLTNCRAHGDERKYNLRRGLLLLDGAFPFRGNFLLRCLRRKTVLENVLHGGTTVLRRCARTGQETGAVSCGRARRRKGMRHMRL